MIPVYKPYCPQNSFDHAKNALDSGWISGGEYNQLACEKLQNLLGVKHVILTSSGTTATHLVAKGLKYKFGCKKIIIPSNVYVAAINSFLFDNEFEIVPLPVNLNTWNWDENYIDRVVDDVSALCVVHNVGNIVNVPRLKRLFPHTVFVEDACEGFTGMYENKPVGSCSSISSLSFLEIKPLRVVRVAQF